LRLADRLKVLAITDERLRPDVVEAAREALEGGATAVQLRMKSSPTRKAYEAGLALRRLASEFGALYFVDDRLDVALATGADGVQLGPEDLLVRAAKEVAPNLLVGASVYSVEEALRAQEEGADFLGAGSVFPTPSKAGVRVIGLEGLRQIVLASRIPVVAIGGITAVNAHLAIEAGACGVAAISAIMGAPDVRKAAAELRKAVEEALARRKSSRA